MSTPTPEAQVAFLASLQRLLAEGSFVSTYKHALLLALADLAVELGDDSDAPLVLPVSSIAEKFIAIYWRQAAPFTGRTASAQVVDRDAGPLRQATGQPAEILTKVVAARQSFKSLASLRADHRAWGKLVSQVGRIVSKMPLWKLQTIGKERFDFLYPNVKGSDHVELRPGVAFCLRRFHGLVEDLVRGAWIRFVRGLKGNHSALGQVAGLDEFLFGSERADLSGFRPILEHIQRDVCFYCARRLQKESAVDHFIPWVRYPVDLGHNFVLAHPTCNGNKGDRLAAYDHLARWCARNEEHGPALDTEFAEANLVADRPASTRITRWAYSQVEASAGQVWVFGDDLVALDARWRTLARMSR